jgi:hypothetical protein
VRQLALELARSIRRTYQSEHPKRASQRVRATLSVAAEIRLEPIAGERPDRKREHSYPREHLLALACPDRTQRIDAPTWCRSRGHS